MNRLDRKLRRGLHRSRNGVFLGVCRGIAEYFDLSLFWTRTVVVILLFITGIWPIAGLYLLAALLMKSEPVIPIGPEDEREFYHSYTESPHRTAERLKRRRENLESRIRRMEDIVTAKEFEWGNRL